MGRRCKWSVLEEDNMSNFVRYQHEYRSLSKEALRERISCGHSPYRVEFHPLGCRETRGHQDTVWIPNGIEVTTSVSITEVNQQLVATPKEDGFVYFWVSGARGSGHNIHKQLLLPQQVELLAAGAKPAHKTAWCNKITSGLFRVPKGTKRVMIGDMLYGEHSHAIDFIVGPDGDWSVTVDPYDRFCALNPNWKGLWAEGKDGKPPLPLPALVE